MSKLYIISPPRISDIPKFCAKLNEALTGKLIKEGALSKHAPALFQLRLKDCNEKHIEGCIEAIKPITKQCKIPFILNDDINLALKHNIGVHIGEDDGNLEEAKTFKQKSQNIIGVSCYNSLQRATEFEQYVDYVSFGAVFPTKTKQVKHHCNLQIIQQYCAKDGRAKVCVIGGINEKNIQSLSHSLPAIDYFCVISAIWKEEY
jgi:thiamine-phosphate pyrophosphorylase